MLVYREPKSFTQRRDDATVQNQNKDFLKDFRCVVASSRESCLSEDIAHLIQLHSASNSFTLAITLKASAT